MLQPLSVMRMHLICQLRLRGARITMFVVSLSGFGSERKLDIVRITYVSLNVSCNYIHKLVIRC